ncbi:MAG: 2OG-Fe(II) oxygenase [Bdellovibrionales bacterium]
MQVLQIPRFFRQAGRLRSVFDQRFADPLQAKADRFQWDYWHVPDEYTLLRTPSYHYFPARLYESFHRHLVMWGRENLGCHDVSPPWLSLYVEGCRQNQHQDLPHGPLAFVYSLTRHYGRNFKGGETRIPSLRKKIPPHFNQLTIFNPGLPHSVSPVRGTHDPRYGRLVINGWFVQPRPFWIGPHSAKEVGRELDRVLGGLRVRVRNSAFVSFRLNIGTNGRVQKVTPLIDTLSKSDRSALKEIAESLKGINFRPKNHGLKLTLPITFA